MTDRAYTEDDVRAVKEYLEGHGGNADQMKEFLQTVKLSYLHHQHPTLEKDGAPGHALSPGVAGLHHAKNGRTYKNVYFLERR